MAARITNSDRACSVRRRSASILGWFLHVTLFSTGLITTGAVSVPGADSLPPPPTASMTNRLTVAILGFENRTGDSSLDFWRVAAESLLERALSDVGMVRLALGKEYALRQIHLRPGDPLSPNQAQKLGELLEARRVIWGRYERRERDWLVIAQMMNVATGKVLSEARANSTNWFQIRDDLAAKILPQLNVVPTPVERERMLKRWTTSLGTLEWISEAKWLEEQRRPESEIETAFRHAVEADPKCAHAQVHLAAAFFDEGRLEDAEKAARMAVKLDSVYGMARVLLGAVLAIEQKYDEAERSLQTATRLDPTDALGLERLGELYDSEGMPSRAKQTYEQAARLDPFSASIHAHLACEYLGVGEQARGVAEIKEAERLASPAEINAEQYLGHAYEYLHDVPSAIAHFEKLITAGKQQGLNPSAIRQIEERAQALKARLAPASVPATEPKQYSKEQLTAFVREHLSPADLTQVTNPLVGTPEMERWAHALAAGATNHLQKAHMLFDALAAHVDRQLGGTRTAREVFAVWNSTNSSFRCSEYAAFYVSLSRACGLNTYCALVDEDSFGRVVSHECACLFLGTNAFLVDPSYFWFGVPHHKFRVLNDVETEAVWLSQQINCRQQQIACELAPQLAIVRFNRIFGLLDANDIESASRELPDALKLDPDGQMALLARGGLALCQGNLQTSVSLLEMAVAKNPDSSDAQMLLGQAYWRAHRLHEARGAFRSALLGEIYEAKAEYERHAIAQIDESTGDSEIPGHEPKSAVDFVRRADSHAWKGEFDQAISDYTEAVRLNPKDVVTYEHRAYAYLCQRQMDQTISDCTEALHLDPNDVLTRTYRAEAYHSKGKYSEAITDLELAVRLTPNDPGTLIRLSAQLSNCPDVSLRNGTKAIECARKACELTGWQQWEEVATLAGACAAAGDFEAAKKYEEQATEMDGVDEKARNEIRQWISNSQPPRDQAMPTNLWSKIQVQNKNLGDTNVDVLKLRQSAASGDAQAQSQLAGFLNEGTHGCPTNRIEAYKWAALAAKQGSKDASYLVQELELFMTARDVALAKAFLREAQEKYPQGQTGSSAKPAN